MAKRVPRVRIVPTRPVKKVKASSALDATVTKLEEEAIKDEQPTVKLEETDDGPPIEEAPAHWLEIYDLVREMREHTPAPVDTMGCERIPDHAGPLSGLERRFHLLITLMLSSQTKDETNSRVMAALRERFSGEGGLTLQNIIHISEAELDKIIYPVGFHSRKARYIKASAQILIDKFNGDIPLSTEEMMSLPGVGPKMAFLLRSAAWGFDDGIGVDVHVHRLANMWGWVPKEAHPTPEKTRLHLERWLPKQYWREINTVLVGFGQTICPSQRPRCMECTVAPTGLCKRSPIRRVV